MALGEQQIRRYARHILLPDIGGVGQARLLASAALVPVGPSRPGSSVALAYLAAGGVGTLVVDDQSGAPVEPREARANILLGDEDTGEERIGALRRRIRALNPDVSVVAAGNGAPADLAPYALDVSEPADAGDLASALAAGGSAATRALIALSREP